MSPDQAKAALEIATGTDVTPKDDVVESESDRVALNKERNRNRFNFDEAGIEPGEILEFKKANSLNFFWRVFLSNSIMVKIFFEGKNLISVPVSFPHFPITFNGEWASPSLKVI